MKAILLIRVSTDAQDLVQQKERVVDAAKRDGFNKEDLIIIEDKESAVKLSEEERNGLNKLKEYIENDSSISVVYSYEISRISRQAKIVFSIRDFLIKHHIQLIILNPYFKMLKDDGTLSETSNIFFGIFASMAENEGYIRKARLRRGVEKAKSLGRHAGGQIPIGYTTNKQHNYMIDPTTGPLIEKIFEMYVERDMSMRKIAKELKSRGYFESCTYLTCVRNIEQILHRDYYCGTKVGMPAIISREMFDKAQAIKKRNMLETSRTPNKAILKGLLRDANTGLLLSANTAAKNYYSKRMQGVAVAFKIIEPIVWQHCIEIHSEYHESDYSNIVNQIEHDMQVMAMKKRSCQDQLDNLMKQIDKLEERIILGKIRSEVADEIEARINKNIHDTKIIMDNATHKLEQLKHQQAQILDESKRTYDYAMLDVDEKIMLLNKVIDKVMLYREPKSILHIKIYNKYNTNTKELAVDCWKNKII